MNDAPASLRESRPPAVELRSVSKHFGSTRAVNDVSFRIPEGSIFGLIGPNGAGKTTTFSMMAGYLTPTSGDLFVLDHRPEAAAVLKGKLGVLPQDALLPPGEEVGEFLVYLARLQGIDPAQAEKSAREVLAEVDGATWWNTRCKALSHGMAKRVGIAQAFLGDPRVVLLDEPTAGLDPRVAYQIRQLIKARKGRCTVVVSSHNLRELEEVCDHAAILDRGQLVVAGTMAELTASAEEVRFELARGPVPEEEIRTIAGVKTVAFEPARRELIVTFERGDADAEEMIRRVLLVLLDKQARISGVSKGRGLEQRVMELTLRVGGVVRYLATAEENDLRLVRCEAGSSLSLAVCSGRRGWWLARRGPPATMTAPRSASGSSARRACSAVGSPAREGQITHLPARLFCIVSWCWRGRRRQSWCGARFSATLR
jgi:ABC-type multidrug transport system ATPase subunit